MAIKINHVGIAVSNLEESLKLYCQVLDLKPEDYEIETVADQKVRVVMIPVGESKIELLESTDPEGPIGKFVGKRGEGIHHLTIGVADIRGKLAELKADGIPLINEEPRTGAGGHQIAFLHPKATKALLELVQE